MVDYGGGGLHKYPQTTLQRKRRFQHYRFLGNHWPDPSTSKWKLCHFTSKRSNLRHTYSFSFFTIYIFHSQTLPPLGSVSVDSLSLSLFQDANELQWLPSTAQRLHRQLLHPTLPPIDQKSGCPGQRHSLPRQVLRPSWAHQSHYCRS